MNTPRNIKRPFNDELVYDADETRKHYEEMIKKEHDRFWKIVNSIKQRGGSPVFIDMD